MQTAPDLPRLPPVLCGPTEGAIAVEMVLPIKLRHADIEDLWAPAAQRLTMLAHAAGRLDLGAACAPGGVL